MSVTTDIRTNRPVFTHGAAPDPAEKEARLKQAVAAKGIAQTPQAEELRNIILALVVRRVNVILEDDEVVTTLRSMLRRIELVDISAEEAARLLMKL